MSSSTIRQVLNKLPSLLKLFERKKGGKDINDQTILCEHPSESDSTLTCRTFSEKGGIILDIFCSLSSSFTFTKNGFKWHPAFK